MFGIFKQPDYLLVEYDIPYYTEKRDEWLVMLSAGKAYMEIQSKKYLNDLLNQVLAKVEEKLKTATSNTVRIYNDDFDKYVSSTELTMLRDILNKYGYSVKVRGYGEFEKPHLKIKIK